MRPAALDDETRGQSVRDPRFQFRDVNTKYTLDPRTDEAARAELAVAEHAFDFRLRFVATRTLMRDEWRGDFEI